MQPPEAPLYAASAGCLHRVTAATATFVLRLKRRVWNSTCEFPLTRWAFIRPNLTIWPFFKLHWRTKIYDSHNLTVYLNVLKTWNIQSLQCKLTHEFLVLVAFWHFFGSGCSRFLYFMIVCSSAQPTHSARDQLVTKFDFIYENSESPVKIFHFILRICVTRFDCFQNFHYYFTIWTFFVIVYSWSL
jgi:hypothetical protein